MNASQIAKCLSIVTMIRHAFQRKACVMKTMIASKIEKQFNYELFGNLLVKLKCSKTALLFSKPNRHNKRNVAFKTQQSLAVSCSARSESIVSSFIFDIMATTLINQ